MYDIEVLLSVRPRQRLAKQSLLSSRTELLFTKCSKPRTTVLSDQEAFYVAFSRCGGDLRREVIYFKRQALRAPSETRASRTMRERRLGDRKVEVKKTIPNAAKKKVQNKALSPLLRLALVAPSWPHQIFLHRPASQLDSLLLSPLLCTLVAKVVEGVLLSVDGL